MNTTSAMQAAAISAPAAAGSAAAADSTSAATIGPRQAGAEAARDLITALADAGMSQDRIGPVIEDVLGYRHDQPTAVSEDFYDAFASTAATLVADLRDLEAG